MSTVLENRRLVLAAIAAGRLTLADALTAECLYTVRLRELPQTTGRRRRLALVGLGGGLMVGDLTNAQRQLLVAVLEGR